MVDEESVCPLHWWRFLLTALTDLTASLAPRNPNGAGSDWVCCFGLNRMVCIVDVFVCFVCLFARADGAWDECKGLGERCSCLGFQVPEGIGCGMMGMRICIDMALLLLLLLPMMGGKHAREWRTGEWASEGEDLSDVGWIGPDDCCAGWRRGWLGIRIQRGTVEGKGPVFGWDCAGMGASCGGWDGWMGGSGIGMFLSWVRRDGIVSGCSHQITPLLDCDPDAGTG